jgi:hypothetical protein
MWEIPWWMALILAWAAGSLGFLCGVLLAAAAKAERDLDALYESDVQTGRPHADVLCGDDVHRWLGPDARPMNFASSKMPGDDGY